MTAKKVKSYKLRPAARDDLEHIWLSTARDWSVDQADTYLRLINAAFDALVEHPELSRLRYEISPPVRIKHIQSHIIIYQIDGDMIDIIRIRHNHENWASNPIGRE